MNCTIDSDGRDKPEQVHADEWASVSVSINEDGEAERRCMHCGCYESEEDDIGCLDGETREDDGHEFENQPLSWCNSIGATADAEKDYVTVRISVGDPRGCFAMRVERGPDGELRLSVPYPDEPLPHMKLTQLGSPGYYKIG